MFKHLVSTFAVAALVILVPASLASAAKGGKSADHRQDAAHGHHGGKGGNSAAHRQDGKHRHQGHGGATTRPADSGGDDATDTTESAG